MTEETSEVSESTPETTPQENQPQSEAQSETKESKPEGWEQVEFTPEQQARFNRVYGQVKSLESKTKDYESLLREQFEVIEQLRTGQGQIISHLQETDYAKTEAQLKEYRTAAYARGDAATADEINDRLADLKIQKKMAELEKKAQPAPIHPKGVRGEDVVTQAVNNGAISRDDAQLYRDWANEVDMHGNLVRPWVNENDTRNMAAAIEGKAVFNNPSLANKPFAEKLKEIDRRMGVVNQKSGQTVLSSTNLTRGSKMNTVKLTDYQEKVAVRTQFAGRGKSAQDHIEAYRKQVQEVKGVR